MPIHAEANQQIRAFEAALHLNGAGCTAKRLFTGIDLGTAYIVTAVVDALGAPVAGVVTRSRSSIRDGLVLDYVGAINILRQQIEKLQNAGFPLQVAAAAIPPGTAGRNAQAFGNVVRAVGLDLSGLVDEPTAAALVLGVREGAVVDIGGGTTGISVLQGGEVVYTADEPTGGVHIDLVLAGHYGIAVTEAEQLKRDPARQTEIAYLVHPVFQKMAQIVRRHLREHPVSTLYLVGGTSCFPGIEAVMEQETGLEVLRPHNPLLVTPLGIALDCARTAGFGKNNDRGLDHE